MTLGLALGTGCPIPSDGESDGDCSIDIDFRGDRICDQGACIDPSGDDDDDDDGPRPGPSGDDGDSGDGGESDDDDDDDTGQAGSCSGTEPQCNGSSSMSLYSEGQ